MRSQIRHKEPALYLGLDFFNLSTNLLLVNLQSHLTMSVVPVTPSPHQRFLLEMARRMRNNMKRSLLVFMALGSSSLMAGEDFFPITLGELRGENRAKVIAARPSSSDLNAYKKESFLMGDDGVAVVNYRAKGPKVFCSRGPNAGRYDVNTYFVTLHAQGDDVEEVAVDADYACPQE